MPARALSTDTLGAWLVKARGAEASTREHVRAGFVGVQTWCVQPMALAPLDVPLLRSELVGHPDLAALEVLRMPAGSNPSYVTPGQLEVLVALREELAESV